MSTSLSSETKKAFESVADLTIELMGIDDVIPYWRNPRRITTEAVNAVAESIKRYGYQQPIVVDEQRVIIIGHTRYSAMRRMGVTDVAVQIAKNLTPKQVKELRIIDNKTSEYAIWDFELLNKELATLDRGMTEQFFAEVAANLEPEGGSEDMSLSFEVEHEPQRANVDDDDAVGFVCPSCFHGWSQTVTKKQIMKGLIKGE